MVLRQANYRRPGFVLLSYAGFPRALTGRWRRPLFKAECLVHIASRGMSLLGARVSLGSDACHP
eukprot:9303730-Pyramimonas_sp.AAC.1